MAGRWDGLGPIHTNKSRQVENRRPPASSSASRLKERSRPASRRRSMNPARAASPARAIIGDRGTGGRPALAVFDTIIDQKGKGVICVYARFGQKSRRRGRVERSRRTTFLSFLRCPPTMVVVRIGVLETAPMMYIAP